MNYLATGLPYHILVIQQTEKMIDVTREYLDHQDKTLQARTQ